MWLLYVEAPTFLAHPRCTFADTRDLDHLLLRPNTIPQPLRRDGRRHGQEAHHARVAVGPHQQCPGRPAGRPGRQRLCPRPPRLPEDHDDLHGLDGGRHLHRLLRALAVGARVWRVHVRGQLGGLSGEFGVLPSRTEPATDVNPDAIDDLRLRSGSHRAPAVRHRLGLYVLGIRHPAFERSRPCRRRRPGRSGMEAAFCSAVDLAFAAHAGCVSGA